MADSAEGKPHGAKQREQLMANEWISKTGTALATARGLEYAVFAGAVTGGGLTVIAHAPKPASLSILGK